MTHFHRPSCFAISLDQTALSLACRHGWVVHVGSLFQLVVSRTLTSYPGVKVLLFPRFAMWMVRPVLALLPLW